MIVFCLSLNDCRDSLRSDYIVLYSGFSCLKFAPSTSNLVPNVDGYKKLYYKNKVKLRFLGERKTFFLAINFTASKFETIVWPEGNMTS